MTGGLEKCCNETCRVDGLRCNGGGAVAMTDGMLQEKVDAHEKCCNGGRDDARGCNGGRTVLQ